MQAENEINLKKVLKPFAAIYINDT